MTLDASHAQFDPKLLKSMIAQSGMTREEFYRQTETAARKIGKKVLVIH